jgi:hypothetical protein
MLNQYYAITNSSRENVINSVIHLKDNNYKELPEAVFNQEDLNLFINADTKTYFFIDTPSLQHVKSVLAAKNRTEVSELSVESVQEFAQS